ncbi:glycosyltransferase [Bacillus infantis]|uniref:tetratricopeptide repeat-containing glycosyltransferase family 2 protein n=1 Tax=Bacillus infantis TaxID=324767 RepID=UPI002004316A|nr:glycosyltransferase family 2 protein [Bacillus infantis]MCK6206016.1 glycosyltransferase [Bacillus infantis]
MGAYISLCMIVKNESKVLRRCLESVVGIIDEIIIIDTGSSDGTQELAMEYTDKVYEIKWNENFSEARNYAASKASGEWILVLDADEYIYKDHLIEAISYLKNSSELLDIYAVNIMNFVGDNGENVIQHKHVRFYRNNKKIEFFRSVHEQLKYIDDRTEMRIGVLPSLIIFHTGYLRNTVNEKNKNIRNRTLIKQELKQTNTGFDLYNLANELRSTGENEEALKIYIKAYQKKIKFTDEWVARCSISIVQCLIALERFTEALYVVKDATKIYVNSPDFVYLEGLIYFYKNNYNEAKKNFHYILLNANQLNNVINSPDYKDYLPNLKLGEIYELEKDYSLAVKHYIGALNYNRYSIEAISRVILLLSKFHTEAEIHEFLVKRILIGSNKQFLKSIVGISLNLKLTELADLLIKDILADSI